MTATLFAATILSGYLLGSIPTGFLAARLKGIDIRTVGSGNIGATNVFRAVGKFWGVVVLLLDGLKGYAACAWLPLFALELLGSNLEPDAHALSYLQIAGGFSAVLGHNYTCWLEFKGGKGIATSAGILAGLMPFSLMVALMLWAVVFFVTRYVSLASIAAAASLPVSSWLHAPRDYPILIVAFGLGAMAIFKHRSNIQRLKSGTENRFEFGRKPTKDSS